MVYLAYTGMQDMFLTERPSFSHFRTVYVRDVPSVTKIVEQPFDQTKYVPGDTLISTFGQNGDYLSSVTLKVILPSILPTSSYYVYPDYLKFIGKTMSVFDSTNDQKLFDLSLNGLLVTTENTNWATANVTLPGSTYFTYTNNKFDFTVSSSTYAVFNDIEFANFWGFVTDPIQLFGGFVKFTNASQSQVTFQESGWLPGDQVYDASYSYLDDTVYKLIQYAGLYIGKQLIQEFDSATIKFYKETTTSYKNRPTLKLLEGNDNIVDDTRTYYFELPFIRIPVHALSRHDIQVRLTTNPLTNLEFNASLLLSFDLFSVNLPSEYTIQVPQVSYFSPSTNQKISMRNSVKTLVINGSTDFKLELNGEFYTDDVYSKSTTLDNFLNVPVSSKGAVVLKNPINMSRIRDQKFTSSNTSVYAESVNFLKISNDISGLAFDTTETGGYPVVTGNLTNPVPIVQQTYIFDEISSSVSSMQCFYSMRLTNIAYTGPVVRLRDPDTDEEADFYTDTTQSFLRTSDGVSIDDFPGRKVVVWYDQSLNKNHMTQYIKQLQPTLTIDEESGLYTVGIFNVTSNQESVPPDSYMDITTPVHPQQFAIIAKFREVGGYEIPSTIFSSVGPVWRLTDGDISGDSNSGDWVAWPQSGSTIFKVNGSTSETNLLENQWYVITSYHTQTYFGSDVLVVGAEAQGLYQVPKRSANAYFLEFGFLDNTTMATDANSYYQNRPNEIVPEYYTYPPQNLTDYMTTFSGLQYGNGTYTVTESSHYSSAYGWQAFNPPYFFYYWVSDATYDSTTGVYMGSASIGGYSGEYLTIQLPESIKLKKIISYGTTTVEYMNILGSNDGGSTWIFLKMIHITELMQTIMINSSTSYSSYALVCDKLIDNNYSGKVFGFNTKLFSI